MEFVSVIQVGRIKASAPVAAEEAAAMEIYPCDHNKTYSQKQQLISNINFGPRNISPWLTVIYLEFGRLVYQRHHILDVIVVAIKYLHLADSRASCSYFRDHLCDVDASAAAATVWCLT